MPTCHAYLIQRGSSEALPSVEFTLCGQPSALGRGNDHLYSALIPGMHFETCIDIDGLLSKMRLLHMPKEKDRKKACSLYAIAAQNLSEFRDVELSDWVTAPNTDELLRDLAITNWVRQIVESLTRSLQNRLM